MSSMAGSSGGAARSPLVRFGTPDHMARRLICLPFAGGGPAAFRLWPRDLPEDVEVVAVLLPGRDPSSRETPLDDARAILDAILPEVRSATDVPYALFGHSLGAALAFELTVALEAEAGGRAPDALFVSGRRSAHESAQPPMIHALADDEFLDAIDARFGGVPAVVRQEPDLLALLLPKLRADVRTFETYAPLTDRRVRCPVHVYGGAADTHPSPAQLHGWQHVAEREISVRTFPGDHFYLMTARPALVADIARQWTESSLQVGAE